MGHLIQICTTKLVIVCLSILTIFSFTAPVQALESENQPYFIKQLKQDSVLAVSPNFRGELTQESLLPALSEISDEYYIKATKSVKAEKLNGKVVPGLIVYVEAKSPSNNESNKIIAQNPN